jgi:glycerophosphoryl diester phosphodiesterase
VLEMVRDLSPEQPLGFLMHKWDEHWQSKVDGINAASIHVNYRCLTQKRIDALKSSKKSILAYTVNRTRKANKLFSMGVDGIFTDKPDLLGVEH